MNPMSNIRSASSMTRISNVAEGDDALLLVVEEAARRSHEEVRHRLHLVALEAVVHAPEDREGRQARMAPEDLGVRADLRDELAGRRDDQGPGAPGGRRGLVLAEGG